MPDVQWNDSEAGLFLHEAEYAVVSELTPQVAMVAFNLAPVGYDHGYVHRTMRRTHSTGHGGKLKASVRTEYGEDSLGVYGLVLALWYGRFLDPRAKQLHRLYPFLPTALYTVCAGRIMHF